MNVALIILGHLFTFVAAFAGLLLGLSFTDVQLEQYPFLHWLDGKQIHFAVTAIFSLFAAHFINAFKDVKKEFETVQGPKGEVFEKATESGFEKELKEAADDLKVRAKRYFDAAEEDFKSGSYEDAARNCLKSTEILPTMSAYLNAGISWYYISNYSEAKQAFFDGLHLAREKGNEKFEGMFLGNIGLVYADQGKLNEALEIHQQALEIDKKIGNPLGQAQDLGNIGNVYFQQGKLNEALKAHQQALEIDKKIGNPLGEAQDLGNIGLVYRNQGKLDEALKAHQQALEIHKKVGNPLGQANQLGNIGIVYANQGKLDEALEALQQSLETHKKIGNPLGVANQLGNIGNVYYQQGKLEDALRNMQQARDIFERIGTPRELKITEDNIKLATQQLESSQKR